MPAVLLFAIHVEAGGKTGSTHSEGTSEAPGRPVAAMYPPLVMSQLGVEDGLPQSQVTALAQDSTGFMWLGTQEGLARYDGHKIKSYKHDPEDPKSLSGSFITALHVDREGRLWIGTGENGLNRYDSASDSFVHYRHDPEDSRSIGFDGITAIYSDRAGTIWVGLANGGVNSLDPATLTITREPITTNIDAIQLGPVTSIIEDKSGSLWIGMNGGGLVKYDRGAANLVHYRHRSGVKNTLSSNEITALHEDDDGYLWIGTANSGLNRLAPDRKNFRRYRRGQRRSTISDGGVTAILEDRDGRLWITTKNQRTGLNRLDRKAGTFVRYKSDPLLTIFQDRGGVIWLGTLGFGALYFDELRLSFGHYETHNPVTSLYEDSRGRIWVATPVELRRYDRKEESVTSYPSIGSLKIDTWVTTIYEDRRGVLWIGVDGKGLTAYDPATGRTKRYRYDPTGNNSLGSDRVDKILEAPDGTLWMATWGGGVNRFDPRTETFESFLSSEFEDNRISSNHIYTMEFDRKDPKIIWLGTAAGLNRFDTNNGHAEVYRHDENDPNSLSHDSVLSIHQDEQGVLWLGTYGGGMNRFDPSTGTFKRYGEAQGLRNDTIYCVLPGQTGQLWLSTNGGGLAAFDKATESFVGFDTADGVQGKEFVQGSCHRSESGELLFGGLSGFNVFHPEDIQRDTYVPPVVLTRFQLFNEEGGLERPIWTQPAIDLGYGDSVFSFEFAALSFAGSERNQYSYKLEGLHDEWITSDRNFVTYTNLDGGDYVFKVKAANRHGVWNEEPISVSVHVDPPPWKTWWAYTIYVLLLASIVLAVLRRQQKRMAELQMQNRLQEVERNLELTGAVQTGFLPSQNHVETPRFRLYGFYRPADQASGDWWYYVDAKQGRHLILVGDVTGHGPGPAMVTAAAGTTFRVSGSKKELQDCLREMNAEVLAVGQGRYHMTMSAVEFDDATGRFVMHSAGGLPVLCLRATGRPKVVGTRGTPLGQAEFIAGTVEGKLEPGDRMIILTDGIPELNQPNGRMLGMRGFQKIYQRTRGLPLTEAVEQIVREADVARGEMTQDDDWTFAMVEYIGDGLSDAPRSPYNESTNAGVPSEMGDPTKSG